MNNHCLFARMALAAVLLIASSGCGRQPASAVTPPASPPPAPVLASGKASPAGPAAATAPGQPRSATPETAAAPKPSTPYISTTAGSPAHRAAAASPSHAHTVAHGSAVRSEAAASAPTGSGPVPAGYPGGPEAAARETLLRLQKVKLPQQIADYFSNRSDAMFGMILMLPIAMGIAMQGAMPGQTAAHHPPGMFDPQLKKSYEAVLHKYGLDKTSQTPAQRQAILDKQGRPFLKDMGGLLARIESDRKMPATAPHPGLPVALQNLTYKVVSPTEVDIQSASPQAQAAGKLRAIVEAGYWRIDIDSSGMGSMGRMGPGGPMGPLGPMGLGAPGPPFMGHGVPGGIPGGAPPRR